MLRRVRRPSVRLRPLTDDDDAAVLALNEVNGFRSCTLVNPGKIAHRTNRSFRFDPDKLVIDVPECQALIDQPERAPWKLEV